MNPSDDDLILEHLVYIRAAVEEIDRDLKNILAMVDRIEQSMKRMIGAEA